MQLHNLISSVDSLSVAFWRHAGAMLVHSSILILALVALDATLRKHTRAAVRYALWMILLLKLVLPTGLTSPLSVGAWLGQHWTPEPAIPRAGAEYDKDMPREPEAPRSFPPGAAPLAVHNPTEGIGLDRVADRPGPLPPTATPATPGGLTYRDRRGILGWQAILLATWAAGVLVLTALLLQRWCFVADLLRQAQPADERTTRAFAASRSAIGIPPGRIGLKVSPNMVSPAVCGVFRPTVVLPSFLIDELDDQRLRTVLAHELAHVRRWDPLVNALQTGLQIVYFYNPLLWLANALIRRAREEATDEMVLVALGKQTADYSRALVDVADLAVQRPALSLRLIGVVESKSAVAQRVKRILSRPMPKTARVGIGGYLATLALAAFLLPMACSDREPRPTATSLDTEAAAESMETPEEVQVAATVKQMQSIIVADMDLRQASLEDTLAFLLAQVTEHEAATPGHGKRVVLVFHAKADLTPPITCHTRRVSLYDNLNIIAGLTDMDLYVGDGVARLLPRTTPPEPSVNTTFEILPKAAKELTREAGGTNWVPVLTQMGIPWPEGSSAQYDQKESMLSVANSDLHTANLEYVLSRLEALPKHLRVHSSRRTPRLRQPRPCRDEEPIGSKLAQIVIPECNFRQANIFDVCEFLSEASVEHDQAADPGEKRGVDVVLDARRLSREVGGDGIPLITFRAEKAALGDILDIVARVAGAEHWIEDSVVMLGTRSPAPGRLLYRGHRVEAREIENMERNGDGDWKRFVRSHGFGWHERSTLYYAPWARTVIVTATRANIGGLGRILSEMRPSPSSTPVNIQATLIAVESLRVPKLTRQLGIDLTPETGGVLFTLEEADRVKETLLADPSARLLGNANVATAPEKESSSRSAQGVTYVKKRPDGSETTAVIDAGFSIDVLPRIQKNYLFKLQLGIDHTGVLGTARLSQGDIPVVERLAFDTSFCISDRTCILMHMSGDAWADLVPVKDADTAGAGVVGRPRNLFLFISLKRLSVQNRRGGHPWKRQLVTTCRFIVAGPEESDTIRTATGQSGTTLLALDKYGDLLARLRQTGDTKILACLPVVSGSMVEARIRRTQSIPHDDAGELVFYDYRQGFTTMSVPDGLSDRLNVTAAPELVLPTRSSTGRGISPPATIRLTQQTMLTAGHVLISPVTPPPGVLAAGQKCFMVLGARHAGAE